jgi:hypothetical protein
MNPLRRRWASLKSTMELEVPVSAVREVTLNHAGQMVVEEEPSEVAEGACRGLPAHELC